MFTFADPTAVFVAILSSLAKVKTCVNVVNTDVYMDEKTKLSSLGQILYI